MKNLEEILLNLKTVQNLTEEQTNETLKIVLANETSAFLKESLVDDKVVVKEGLYDESNYNEEVVDANGDPVTDGDVNPTDMGSSAPGDSDLSTLGDDNVPTETNNTSDGAGELPNGEENIPGESNTTTSDDDEVLDLSDASFEEVLEHLKDLPDDTVIEIKKNPPTFDVDTNVNEEKCDECEKEQVTEWVSEEFEKQLTETTLLEYKKIISEYESKLSKLQEQFNAKSVEVQQLQEQATTYEAVLTESQEALKTMSVHHTNLLHITKLFTEQTVNLEEKLQIAKQFDNVKTINESVILYNALNMTLNKNVSGKPLTENVQKIKEEIKTAASEKKQIIKEEKTYVDPTYAVFDRHLNHKI